MCYQVDVQRVIDEVDVDTLQRFLENITFSELDEVIFPPVNTIVIYRHCTRQNGALSCFIPAWHYPSSVFTNSHLKRCIDRMTCDNIPIRGF